MSNAHDHAAMVVATTTAMNHDHHMMNVQTNTSAISSGAGLHMKDMMMMAMTFHGGYKEQILFDAWNTKTVGVFIGSWFAIFFLAVFYEALKTLRDNLAKGNICQECSPAQNRQQIFTRTDDQENERSNDTDLIPSVRTENLRTIRASLLSIPHIIQTFLHIIQMTLSYLLMLIAMTFNTYLLLAIIFGAGLGHFLFGWRRSSVIDHNEHCH